MSDETTTVTLTRAWPYARYGAECGPGWKGLYQPLIELCVARGITIAQVKEKFGGLRFYVAPDPPDAPLKQIIDAAEAHSYHVCEHCGADAITGHDAQMKPVYAVTTGPTLTRRWIKTLCAPCREKWDNS